MRTPLLRTALPAGLSLTSALVPSAAASDELVAEQQYSIAGVAEASHAFWNPALWRLTPAAPDRVPTSGDFLYFRTKNWDETPMALEASNFVLHTGAHSGFTPPAVAPAFGRLYFNNNVGLVFSGVPDSGATLGRFSVAAPHPLQLEGTSSVSFDRSLLDASSALLLDRSGLSFLGDTAPYGESYNARFTGSIVATRTGASSNPVLRVDNSARAEFNAISYSFVNHASDPNTGNAALLKVNSGSATTGPVTLNSAAGTIFELGSTASSLTVDSLTSMGVTAGADPLVLFRAGPTFALPPTRTLALTLPSSLQSFTGSLADLRGGAALTIGGPLFLLGTGNSLGLTVREGATASITDLVTGNGFSLGSTQLNWTAQTSGSITVTRPAPLPLHLDGTASSFTALSSGVVQVPGNLDLDPTASVALLGTGGTIGLPGNIEVGPFNRLSNPAAIAAGFSLSLTLGGRLVGGGLTDFGGGSYTVDQRALSLRGNFASCSVNVAGGALEYAALSLAPGAVATFGDTEQSATLVHSNLALADHSTATFSNTTWGPAIPETSTISQSLTIGSRIGATSATIGGGSTVHGVDTFLGTNYYASTDEMGAVAGDNTLTINGGSTVTGTLAATMGGARSIIAVSGAGTSAGWRYGFLGASAYPSFTYEPPLFTPVFSGDFFAMLGMGRADLNVTGGGRVSFGSFTGAFGDWVQADTFAPAVLAFGSSTVTLDNTGAAFIGSVANAGLLDYRPGALVVGTNGYLLGSGTIAGDGPGGNDLIIAGGAVRPGFSPGVILVQGGFLMESGELVLEVGDISVGGGTVDVGDSDITLQGGDLIVASSITITGGTVRIRPSAEFVAGSSGTVRFFDAPTITIGGGATLIIDPALGGTTFNPTTGTLVITPSAPDPEADANNNGIADGFESVLPASATTIVEWPTMTRAGNAAPVFTFRRNDSTPAGYALKVQWSNDLATWHDLAVPTTSSGDITILDNGTAPDLVTAVLTAATNETKVFARLVITAP